MSALVILDLNGVLCYYTHHDEGVRKSPDAVMSSGKKLWLRPHVEAFLQFLFAHFQVAVWTSNERHNALAAVQCIFTAEQQHRLQFVFSRDECTGPSHWRSMKNLGRIPATTLRIVMIDDTADKIVPPPHPRWELLNVTTFQDPDSLYPDQQLLKVREYLQAKYA